MRIFFIGQSPSRETDGQPPFVGRCGRFLAELLGTTQERMLLDHEFLNVLDRWPGAGIKGDKFPIPEARIAAKRKLEQLRGRAVILLGNNVARAFGFKEFRHMEWYEIRDERDAAVIVVPLVAVVPHPSGVSHYYNDPGKRLIVSEFLRSLVGKIPEHS